MKNSSLTEISVTVLRKRLFALFLAVAFLFLAIFGRLFYVQVVWGEDLQEKAVDQWTREIPVTAKRGAIVDRNGVVLAENSDTYTVFARKKAVKDVSYAAACIAKALKMDEAYLYERLTKTVSSEITVKKQVSKDELNELLSYNLSGVYYARDNTRVYPYGDFLSQVLGFTSTDGKGQAGLELYYDAFLRGYDGEILYETDIVGVEIDGKTPRYIPASDGLCLKLTVDFEIQKIVEAVTRQAYSDSGALKTSAVVIDPKSGEILALSIKPSFNVNEPMRDDLTTLNALSRNTFLSDVYEPGSTFKIITSSANVEEYLKGNKKAFSLSHVFNSSRYRYIGGTRVKCWSDHKNGKHAALNLSGALNNSCNPIFVDIALSLGKETMYRYIESFGFGTVTGVDFSGEAQGMLLPESSVTNVDLARIGFGQTVAVTPLQLVSAVAAVVNGGTLYTPHFVKEIYSQGGSVVEIVNPEKKGRAISENASRIMTELLENVVKDGGGKTAYVDGYRVFGKTGTAQKYVNGVIASGKYVSSFIGGFPANDPKYLLLFIVDEPVGSYYGSTVAAPYGKEIFEKIIAVKGLKRIVNG